MLKWGLEQYVKISVGNIQKYTKKYQQNVRYHFVEISTEVSTLTSRARLIYLRADIIGQY